MAAHLFNRYIWLVDVIYAAGHISLEDINRRWAQSSLNDKHEEQIPRRTFINWRNEVEELFRINIECDRHTNTYYIANASDIAASNLRQWMLNTFSVSHMLNDCDDIRDSIVLEEMPSGTRFLTTIIDAIRERKQLCVTYKRFNANVPHDFRFAPYCMKVFKQRWYMAGCSSDHPGEIRVYALDRVQDMQRTDETYSIPADFSAKRFFRDFYGIFVEQERAPERVVIKVNATGAHYVRSLPLHHTQVETERNAQYSIFEYRLVPTFDFIQELRTHGGGTEVLAPESLVEAFRDTARQYQRLYLHEAGKGS